jgi:putative endonuclease
MAISFPLLYKLILMKAKREERHQDWIVYILRCSDGSFYTGATCHPEKRLADHNRGKASKYTRGRRPVTLLASSVEMNKSEALRLEMKIKKLPRVKKISALDNRLRTNGSAR